MNSETNIKTLMPELTECDVLRIVSRLDRRADKLLIEELKTLESRQGLVVMVPDAETMSKLRIFSSHVQSSFPVYCVFGDGQENRIALEVTRDESRVREIAARIGRDASRRKSISLVRDQLCELESAGDDGEGIDEIYDYMSELIANARREAAGYSAEIEAYCKKVQSGPLM